MNESLLAGCRVLVVEDEMLVLMMTEDMLADLGCRCVSTAATVDEALALIAKQRFDATMLDMNLNGADSYPVAEALSARDMPFMFATGYSRRVVRDDYGDRPVLAKPFQMQDMVEIFNGLLAR